VIPADGEERLATPTPEPSPYVERSGRMHSGAGGPGKVRIDSAGSTGGSTGTGNPSVTYVPRRLRGSDLSLTTITEEPPSWTSSHEIVVQPEVVVETTTCNGSGGCASNRHSSSDQSSSSECSSSESSSPPVARHSGTVSGGSGGSSSTTTTTTTTTTTHFTTKVTATAKVKVEVHAPVAVQAALEPSYYKHRRRRGDY